MHGAELLAFLACLWEGPGDLSSPTAALSTCSISSKKQSKWIFFFFYLHISPPCGIEHRVMCQTAWQKQSDVLPIGNQGPRMPLWHSVYKVAEFCTICMNQRCLFWSTASSPQLFSIIWRFWYQKLSHIVGRITYWCMSIFWLFQKIWHASLSWDNLQFHQFVGTEVI